MIGSGDRPAGPLAVRPLSIPVDIRAYDFKTGKEILSRDHLAGDRSRRRRPRPSRPGPSSASTSSNPGSTSATSGGPAYARGSEINVIPWSQVFVRTK
ncbi:MAG: hypothetical protein M0C28_35655 [Candidatus Moduliflexus flocculans]|nr:hypothetical protein [Candidatus Moduliflexus flocculans]